MPRSTLRNVEDAAREAKFQKHAESSETTHARKQAKELATWVTKNSDNWQIFRTMLTTGPVDTNDYYDILSQGVSALMYGMQETPTILPTGVIKTFLRQPGESESPITETWPSYNSLERSPTTYQRFLFDDRTYANKVASAVGECKEVRDLDKTLGYPEGAGISVTLLEWNPRLRRVLSKTSSHQCHHDIAYFDTLTEFEDGLREGKSREELGDANHRSFVRVHPHTRHAHYTSFTGIEPPKRGDGRPAAAFQLESLAPPVL